MSDDTPDDTTVRAGTPDGAAAPEAALAHEIRRRREAAGLSQNQLANLIGYSRQYVSRAERPSAGLASCDLVRVIDAALSAGGDLIALHASLQQQRVSRRNAAVSPRNGDRSVAALPSHRPDGPAGVSVDGCAAPVALVVSTGAADVASGAEGEAMKRRKFLAHAAAVTVGAVSFDLDRWYATTAIDDPLPSRLGRVDVDQVEQVTAVLRSMDYQHGGGGCRQLAVAQLDRARRLLALPSTEALRRRMWLAVADLHNLVGWTSFDVGMVDAARQHFGQALELAQGAGEPSLVSNVLYRAGRLHLHLGWSEDALRLFQLGQIAAKDSGSQLSLALLSANEAWAYGQLGDQVRAVQSLQRARDDFARAILANEPAWVTFFGEADLDALDGVIHVELAHRDPVHASTGVERLLASIDARGEDMARSRAFETTSLATAYFLSGDHEEGVAAGRRALEMADHIRSRRVIDRLSPLARAATRYEHADARELPVRVRALQTA